MTTHDEALRLARLRRATRAERPCRYCGLRIGTKGPLARHELACGKGSFARLEMCDWAGVMKLVEAYGKR